MSTAPNQTETPDEPSTDELAAVVRELETRLSTLEEERDQLREENDQLRERVDDLEDETTRLESIAKASLKKAGANLDRISELQARELEKGAHILEENVPQGDASDYAVDVADGRLEKIQKEDSRVYLRVPGADDPLGRGGSTTLSHGDLLPIQQLAQMDEDMLRSTTNDLPSRLAAKLWRARDDPTVGDNPWLQGSGEIQEYVKASDMKAWIRREECGVSAEYAKKLVSRTIDRLLEFSNNRLSVTKKTQRKNGLSYKERFVELREDVEIPGENPMQNASDTSGPETAGVLG